MKEIRQVAMPGHQLSTSDLKEGMGIKLASSNTPIISLFPLSSLGHQLTLLLLLVFSVSHLSNNSTLQLTIKTSFSLTKQEMEGYKC
jgi:hypothetical protein